MKPIASVPRPSASPLRAALFASVAVGSLACGVFQANAEVGVAAAVNVDARGRPPGAAPRVITLGSNVVFNEEITTDAAGLVQILLLDGTTFTVGPNSRLTIDEFVYDPETGDARVVASLTKGVFRFVGARTSQTDGGATVTTPVGTIGIRGAVTNISYDPATGQSTAALVAGKSLTVVDGDGTRRIVYETGYTAVMTKGTDGGATTTVRKSTRQETGLIQQQLSSKPGQNGGNTGMPPSDGQTEEVARNNSGLPDMIWLPPLKPVQSSGPELEETTIDGKTQDDLDNDLGDETHTVTGFFGGMGRSNIEGNDNPYALTGVRVDCGYSGCEGDGATNFVADVNAAGDPMSGEGRLEDSQDQYASQHGDGYDPYVDGQNRVLSAIELRFGGSGTELYTDDGGTGVPQQVESYIVPGRTTEVDGEVYEHCTDCDFIQWGWWGTQVTTNQDQGQGIPQDRQDTVVNGTWVAGDISSPAAVYDESALPFGGSAQYNGAAIGTVSRDANNGVATYLATGDFNMTYDFNERSGFASIDNFDGSDGFDPISVGGAVFDNSNDSQALFAGRLNGYNPYAGGELGGSIQGAFVNNGPNVAAGAIGNFAFSGTGVNVVGTVAGVGGAHNP